jgi:replicative DNA helicase
MSTAEIDKVSEASLDEFMSGLPDMGVVATSEVTEPPEPPEPPKTLPKASPPVSTAPSPTAAPEPAVESPKFDFEDGFQTKLAAFVVRDTTFVQRIDGLMRPEFFQNGLEAAWVSMALRYYAKYRKVPSDAMIYSRLIKEDVAARVIDKGFATLMGQHYKALLRADISDRDFVADAVATFARHQAVSAAIIESVPLIEAHKYDQIDKLVRKALDVAINTDGDIYDFGGMIDARAGERLDRASGKLSANGITTGYPLIDDSLLHKGWGRRELSIIMGGAKAGKTAALINFGIQALKASHNVLYVTLEVGSKIIADRMDANITATPVMELGDHTHDVRDKVQRFVTSSGAKFVIKEFPSGAMRVSDLRRLIERYKAQGTVFGLVIVDYADLVAPERVTDSGIENSKSVYVALRGLAMQEDFAMLSATQTNREGFKAAVAKAEHVADDFNKIRIADVIISINRTDEDKANQQARLYFAACRNQPAGFSIRVDQKMDCMQFISKVVGYEKE